MRPSKAVYADVFKALSDETRLTILNLLSGGELTALHLLKNLDISQSTLSYHMKILTQAKLVRVRKDGNWIQYSVNTPWLGSMSRYLAKMQNLAENSIPQMQLQELLEEIS